MIKQILGWAISSLISTVGIVGVWINPTNTICLVLGFAIVFWAAIAWTGREPE